MSKFTSYEFSFKKKTLPILASLLMIPMVGIGQTKEQIKEIQKGSNLVELNKIHKNFKKDILLQNQLKTIAKERGIQYAGKYKGKTYQLVGLDKLTNAPVYYITYNADASFGISTNKLNSSAGIFNLDGENMIVHEWDGGGVLTSHQEFGGRAIQKDQADGLVAHSTHIAGTLIASGVDAKAKGMAPKDQLHAYEWTADEAEMVEAAMGGALVSNHSYGTVAGFSYGNYSGQSGWHWFGSDEDVEYKGFSKYGETDRSWDIIALNAPYYLPVKAAGNDKG